MRLAGKIALVTGGAQGLGQAIVQRFTQEGAQVAVIDLDPQKAQTAGGALALGADLTDPQARKPLIPLVESKLGPIDILVNCHGICVTTPLEEVTEEDWRRTFEVNTTATFFLIQEVAKSMIPRRTGSIVNLASNSAFLPKPEQIDYAASKAAIVSLTRSCAASLGPHGIRVNAIAPGVIPTPMTEGIARARAEIRGATPEEMLAMFEPLTALKRLGTPDEVAKAALFFASDDSSYVTGQTLEVCGGLLMR